MNNQVRNSSHKEITVAKRKKSLQLEIEETIPGPLGTKMKKSETLAQRIPKLPQNKCFPSTGRNLSVSINTSNQNLGLSSSTSTTQAISSSKIQVKNLSLQQSYLKTTQMNFSQFSQKSEQDVTLANWSDVSIPSTPSTILFKFIHKLLPYEQSEILKYPLIYCIGINANKVQASANSVENYGFDDESGDYKAIKHDHVAYRYEIAEILGKGSFGQVFRVFDYKHKVFCALKIIKNKKRFYQQGLLEIEILKHLRKSDEMNSNNVVHIQSSFSFRNHIVIPN
jgi:dual specificity tyrosine-phosphorylation-regulated kinase 2/3/4